MDVLRWLFDAQLRVGDGFILWREVLGNVFGLLSALGGMRRKIWAWPVGIIGNIVREMFVIRCSWKRIARCGRDVKDSYLFKVIPPGGNAQESGLLLILASYPGAGAGGAAPR